MKRSYITEALRTPIGNFGGGLAEVPAPDLGSVLVRQFLERGACERDKVDQVIFGNVLQAAVGMNPARQAAVHGGLPYAVPAYTVNMVCASGLQAVVLGHEAIRSGSASVVIAGGIESMSRAPRALLASRWGTPVGHETAVDLMVLDGLWDAFLDCHMASTVEDLARRFGITRAGQDEFALESHRKAVAALDAGRFADEIVPVCVGDVTINQDERPRNDTSLEKLGKLRPAFARDGTITAGNSSGLNDGGAAVVLSSTRSSAGVAGICAELVASVLVGVDPMDMGVAPVQAIERVLSKAELSSDDVGVWEINEAFAGQVLAVLQQAPIPWEKLNVNGGAVALGHPIGCSGARILVTLLHELKRRDEEYGIAALCIGGGMGLAALVRNCSH
jgi:acetyl-CoA C-acetyltransferase